MIKKTLFFSTPAYLSIRNKQLVIKHPCLNEQDKVEQEITRPIEDIGVLVVEHRQVTFTSGLMDALLENNCALITCNKQNMPTGLMLPLIKNTIQNERFRAQLNASIPLKKQLWQQTIKAKIENQATVLERYRNTEVNNMREWANNIKSGDPMNLEGRAAAYYWKNTFPDHPFFTRNRDGAPPNNLLNYGYAVLRAVVARALVASGLLPTLGIHHHNRYNAYCLADDIMEPYRPYVDELIIKLLEKNSGNDLLNKETKRQLLTIPVLDVKISNLKRPLMIAVNQTTASLARCFEGETRKIAYPQL